MTPTCFKPPCRIAIRLSGSRDAGLVGVELRFWRFGTGGASRIKAYDGDLLTRKHKSHKSSLSEDEHLGGSCSEVFVKGSVGQHVPSYVNDVRIESPYLKDPKYLGFGSRLARG